MRPSRPSPCQTRLLTSFSTAWQTPRSTRGAPGGCWSLRDKPGDQGVGGPGAALVNAQRTAPAFAVLPSSAIAEHAERRSASCQTCPSASARDGRGACRQRRGRLVLPQSAPASRGLDNASERSMPHGLDETAHPSPDPVLDSSNESSKSKLLAAAAASCVVFFVMAWSPFQRSNAKSCGLSEQETTPTQFQPPPREGPARN